MRPERGTSIDVDYGPLRYVLWCCGSVCQEEFTFIQLFDIFLSELISNPRITLIFGLSPVVSDLVRFTLKDLSPDIQTRIPVRISLNTIFCVNMIRKP